MAMRDRQCALNHDAIESAPIVSGVKPTTLSCVYHLSTDDLLWRNFLSPQCRNCSRDPDHAPFREDFFGRVGRAMVIQCTKYEVSRFSRYEAVNGGAKSRRWDGLGRLGGMQGHGQRHHSIERIRLPIRL